MLLVILRETSIQGRPAKVGDLVEASDRDARFLLGTGKAELAPDPPVCKPRKRRFKTDGDS
jgi:hypothetical protein